MYFYRFYKLNLQISETIQTFKYLKQQLYLVAYKIKKQFPI